jgi:hypothetical protein
LRVAEDRYFFSPKTAHNTQGFQLENDDDDDNNTLMDDDGGGGSGSKVTNVTNSSNNMNSNVELESHQEEKRE